MQQLPEMPPGIALLYQNMLGQIDKIKLGENLETLSISKQCLDILQKSIESLRAYINETSFKSESDEIYFFKWIKPMFYSGILYYSKIYLIEIDKPAGSKEIQLKYFKKELRKLQYFFERNRDFYHYHRSGETYMDAIFFIRGRKPLSISLNPYYLDADTSFSTTHDHKVAEILANEQLKDFLENQLAILSGNQTTQKKDTVFKLNTSLSVAHLGCLLRLFYEEKIISSTNQTEFLNFFASHFATTRQENISGTSLRTKYYNIETSTSENVKDLLFQLLNRLKTI